MCQSEIIQLHKKHASWVTVAIKYGAQDMAEDVVQDSYIKLIEWSTNNKNKPITEGLFFFIVRNTALDHSRKNKPHTDLDGLQLAEMLTHEQIFTDRQIEAIHITLARFHWFDAKLLDLYFNLSRKYDQEVSMRTLSEDTGISVATIFNTIKRCKQRIKKALELATQ